MPAFDRYFITSHNDGQWAHAIYGTAVSLNIAIGESRGCFDITSFNITCARHSSGVGNEAFESSWCADSICIRCYIVQDGGRQLSVYTKYIYTKHSQSKS